MRGQWSLSPLDFEHTRNVLVRYAAESSFLFALALALRTTRLVSTTTSNGSVFTAFAEVRARSLARILRLLTQFRFQYHGTHASEEFLVGTLVFFGLGAVAGLSTSGFGQLLAAARALRCTQARR